MIIQFNCIQCLDQTWCHQEETFSNPRVSVLFDLYSVEETSIFEICVLINCLGSSFLIHCILQLTLKRPGLCGWLRPTQFKPRLDWVGSASQVRRYCVDSAAQAFIHALAGCVPRSLQYALCGPCNSRPVHFAAHALDVLATHKPIYFHMPFLRQR